MVLDLIMTYLPMLVALISEVGIIQYAIKSINTVKQSKEFKQVIDCNRVLTQKLNEQMELNKELLTKIDRVNRGKNNNGSK